MDEHQKALRAALKYMCQVETLLKIAIADTKDSYRDVIAYTEDSYRDVTKFSGHTLGQGNAIRFVGKRDLTEQMARAIDRPLEGEWWKE